MLSLLKGNGFSRLIIVYLMWLLSWGLAASMFEVYFFNLGMPMQDIYLANSFWFMAGLIVIPLFRGFHTRNFMMAGISIALFAVLLMFFFPHPFVSYAFRFVVGATHLFFWAPFNTLYYEHRKENNAAMGALYYSIGPFLSLFIPAIAGSVAALLGFQALYLASALLFAITLALCFLFVENRHYEYNPIAALRAINGLKSIIFLEGFSPMVITSVTLEVMLLTFTDKPLEYGAFLSLATVFSILAAMVAARASDRMKTRRELILPCVACLSLSVVFASFSQDIAAFFIAFGLINFFSRIFFPLPLALVVDNSRNLAHSMIGREIVLTAGRLFGALCGYALFLVSDIRTVLLFQGAVLLLYVPLFENRKRKLAKH